MLARVAVIVGGLVLLLGAPLAGAWLAEQSPGAYLHFPPRPVPTDPGPVSWPAVAIMAVVVLGLLALLVAALRRPAQGPAQTGGLAVHTAPRRFPRWGWAALALLAVAWALAWSRTGWLGAWQQHTFTPLWLGWLLTANALAQWRAGTSPLTAQPGPYLALLPASAAFWWYFEYLNRFVQNWYYSGPVEPPGDLRYALIGSLSFATVLPAVVATTALLATVPALNHARCRLPPLRVPWPRSLAAAAVLGGALSLAALAPWPRVFYPFLWGGPLLVLLGLEALAAQRGWLAPLAAGDWRPLALPALAGLACGGLWELWNHYSLVRWHYAVPWVHTAEVFQMPLLGFGGYLPFGVTCALAAALVARALGARPLLYEPPSGR